jgi:hypothetical protein
VAGFRGPLFLLGLSAESSTVQAGFRGPLPVLPIGAVAVVVTQAGFIGPIPILNLGATAAIIIDDYVPEGGPSDGAVRQRLLDDDEVIIMVARAFLTMVH